MGNPRLRSRCYWLGFVARVVQAAVGNSRRFNRSVGLEWVRELSTDAALSTDLLATCAGAYQKPVDSAASVENPRPVGLHLQEGDRRGFSTAAWRTRARRTLHIGRLAWARVHHTAHRHDEIFSLRNEEKLIAALPSHRHLCG